MYLPDPFHVVFHPWKKEPGCVMIRRWVLLHSSFRSNPAFMKWINGEYGIKGIRRMLDFRVYTFLTVCDYMNFTKAAEVLHVTQPAVSQHIRYLETLYGVRLFASEGKKIHLTPAGEKLLYAATTIKNDELFLKDLLHCVPSRGPVLRFGTTRTIGESVISAPLAGYIRRHPDASISVAIGNTDELLHKLTTGEIQFALVEGYYNHELYDSMVYRTEPFIPVCAPGHSFVREPGRLKDLLGEHLLIREPGSGTRDILEKNLEINNIHLADFRNITEIGSMHVILQLLEKDTGITFLYRTAVEQGIKDGTVRELHLRDFQMEHDFTFIWSKGSIYGPEYREICRELQ